MGINYAGEILKGMVIGVANIMPGVSGSALAVSMGVYDEILGAISQIFAQTKKSVKTLFPYVAGALAGVLGLSFAIEWMFETWPLQTNLTFIGLILGGLPAVAKKARGEGKSKSGYLIMIVTFCLAVMMGSMEKTNGTDVALTMNAGQALILVILGVVGAFSMIVPGVSGTMIFMMIGYYRPLIAMINKFVRSAATGDIAGVISCGQRLLPLGIGLMIGMFLCAKLLLWLFAKYETVTYSAILGLVLSSPMVILSGMAWGSYRAVDFLTGAVFLAAALMATVRFSGEE